LILKWRSGASQTIQIKNRKELTNVLVFNMKSFGFKISKRKLMKPPTKGFIQADDILFSINDTLNEIHALERNI